jgi:hypothetical protein
MFANLVSGFKSWAAQPFKSQMDLFGWTLFVGLLIIIVILWTRILAHIFMGVKEIAE